MVKLLMTLIHELTATLSRGGPFDTLCFSSLNSDELWLFLIAHAVWRIFLNVISYGNPTAQANLMIINIPTTTSL